MAPLDHPPLVTMMGAEKPLDKEQLHRVVWAKEHKAQTHTPTHTLGRYTHTCTLKDATIMIHTNIQTDVINILRQLICHSVCSPRGEKFQSLCLLCQKPQGEKALKITWKTTQTGHVSNLDCWWVVQVQRRREQENSIPTKIKYLFFTNEWQA